jgi:hypothetical protein
MTDIKFIRTDRNNVVLRSNDDDFKDFGGFSGPDHVLDGIMQMQEEARQFRRRQFQDSLKATHDKVMSDVAKGGMMSLGEMIYRTAKAVNKELDPVRGTGTDSGAAQAVAADQEAQEPLMIEVNAAYYDELVGVASAANALVQRLQEVLEMPELDRLITAFDILSEHSVQRRELADKAEKDALLGPVVDETDALDKVNAELEKASYFDLIMRCQTHQRDAALAEIKRRGGRVIVIE